MGCDNENKLIAYFVQVLEYTEVQYYSMYSSTKFVVRLRRAGFCMKSYYTKFSSTNILGLGHVGGPPQVAFTPFGSG